MTKFDIGDAVAVCPNLSSISPNDHYEDDWDGVVTGVYITPTSKGDIVSYGVTPNDGGLPRNVLEYRLSSRRPV